MPEGKHITGYAMDHSPENDTKADLPAATPLFQRLLFRGRFQLLGGLLFSIMLPFLLRFAPQDIPLTQDSMTNTLVGASLALILGFFFYRRLINYPDVEGISYSVPIFALTYGLMLAIFVFLRLDYSRYILASSFAMALIWFTGLSILMLRAKVFRIGVIPFGRISELPHMPRVEWYPINDINLKPQGLDAIVTDLRAELPDEWEHYISEAAVSGTRIFHVKQLTEKLTGRVEIEHLSENTLGALNPDDIYLKIKQVIDWTAALFGLIVLSPIMLLIAITIRIESQGPAFFTQQRVGYRGQIFTVFKFRTMRTASGPVNGADAREQAITRNGDDRITRFGGFLRRTRLDELPQMINILRGEMSWIGPRPEAVPLSQWYEAELPFYRYRHIVRPGLSGWAQVMQGHVASPEQVLEKLHYDFYYIKNFSPWLDILIVLKTIRTIITGFGAR